MPCVLLQVAEVVVVFCCGWWSRSASSEEAGQTLERNNGNNLKSLDVDAVDEDLILRKEQKGNRSMHGDCTCFKVSTKDLCQLHLEPA
jgi:hypothetical protein